jgi:hypothetical protein
MGVALLIGLLGLVVFVLAYFAIGELAAVLRPSQRPALPGRDTAAGRFPNTRHSSAQTVSYYGKPGQIKRANGTAERRVS